MPSVEPGFSDGGAARQFIKAANVSWKVFWLTGATVPSMPSWSQALLAVVAAALFFGIIIGSGGASPSFADQPTEYDTGPGEQSIDGVTGPTDTTFSSPLTDNPLDTNTTITIQLGTDGTAYWQLTASYPLTSESEREGFDEIASTFEADDDRDLGLAAYEAAAERVDDDLDRTVRIENREQFATVHEHNESANATGILTVEFEWTGFARADGTELHIDDVLVADGDRWFPGLAGDQRLVIELPDEYGVRSANVSPENGALIWDGPADFTGGELSSTFVGDTNGNGEQPPVENETSLVPWVLIGIAIAVAGGFAYLARDNLRTLIEGQEGPVTTTDSKQSESSSSPELNQVSEDDIGEDEIAPDSDTIDEELLSDEERVEHLLEQNGGRMKQADIVKETDWSNAKVSQLLSGMHEDGRIDKLRIGRENLISFPEESLTADDDEN